MATEGAHVQVRMSAVGPGDRRSTTSRLLVMWLAVITACAGDPGPSNVSLQASTTTVAATLVPTTHAPVSSEVDAVAAVEAHISEVNDGIAGDDFVQQIFKEAGVHISVIEPCHRVDTSELVTASDPDHVMVECTVEMTFDYFLAGGVTDSGAMAFVVAADGAIVDDSDELYVVDGECCPALGDFNMAFYAWLETAYPDVLDQIDPGDGSRFAWPGFMTRNPDHMSIAMQYVDEFVAASDVYPLEP